MSCPWFCTSFSIATKKPLVNSLSMDQTAAHLQMILHPWPQNLLEGIISLFFNPAVNIHALRSKFYCLCRKVTLLYKIKGKNIYDFSSQVFKYMYLTLFLKVTSGIGLISRKKSSSEIESPSSQFEHHLHPTLQLQYYEESYACDDGT